ncbi:hypothetical protein Lal_00024971, partial [Lupinus albus]
MDVYMGETNRECEPEMLNDYEESSQRAVMDICIEEGVSTESNKDKNVQNSFPYKSNKDEEMKKDKSVLNIPTTNEPDQVSDDDCPRPISLFEIISLETDSSTSSTRSFTFPKLEVVEGNETPQMMVKADNNRNNRKGWKRILC